MITPGCINSQITPNLKKASNYIPRPSRTTKIKVVVWCRFHVVARLVSHSLFWNGLYSVRWLLLTAKILKSHQIQLKKPLTLCQDLSDELSLMQCNVILPSLFGWSDIFCFTMINFAIDDYLGQQNFSNHHKLKQKVSNYIPKPFKLLCDIVFPSFASPSDVPYFKLANF